MTPRHLENSQKVKLDVGLGEEPETQWFQSLKLLFSVAKPGSSLPMFYTIEGSPLASSHFRHAVLVPLVLRTSVMQA